MLIQRMMIVLIVLLGLFPTIAQEESSFPVIERCFTPSSEVMLRDGLVFQTVDETRPTLGGEVFDLWVVEGGEARYLLRHTDSRAGVITDGERLLIVLSSGITRMAYLMDSLDAVARPLFVPDINWFDPQWLANGHILFRVFTTDHEPVQVVTVNIDLEPDEMPSSHDLGGWIDKIYEFEGAESAISSDSLRFGAMISPDEQWVLIPEFTTGEGRANLQLRYLADNALIWEDAQADHAIMLMWHPDSGSFVYLQDVEDDVTMNRNEVVWADISGEILLTTQFNHTADDLFMANLLSWSPNGRYLALIGHDVVSGSMRLYMMDFEEQVIIDTCQEIMANQKHIWSPDEMQLVYYGADSWYVADMNTFAITELSSLMSNWYDIPLVWMN